MPLTTTPTNALSYEVLGTIQLSGTEDFAGGEISAYDPQSQRLFSTTNEGLQVVDISDPANPTFVETIQFAFGNDVTSIAIHDGIIAVSVASPNRTDAGRVFLLDADGNVLREFTVGSVPDMVTFTPDGSKILVANEGEATTLDALEEGAEYVNPEGSISVIDLSGGIASATVQTAGFGGFDAEALIAEGVRLFVNVPGFEGLTVSQDLEPEYIAIAPDGLSAVVTQQEANAVALLDLSGPEPVVTDIVSLGLKSWEGLPFDGNDQDGQSNFRTDLPVHGMYMPDAVASFTGSDGETYYVLANEGDDREDFIDPSDAFRLRGLTGTIPLDPGEFPDAGTLRSNAVIGRLNVSGLPSINGDTDGDGDIDQILAYGGRSFSIVDSAGNLVFDSGAQIDTFVDQYFPTLFDDSRSDNKGSEPEGVTIAVIDGRSYAFIALERFNGTMVYDVTDPESPTFTTFLTNEGDRGPESGIFISAEDSPTGQQLYVVSNETSGTLTVYALVKPQTQGGNGADHLVGTILADDMTGGNGDDELIANAGDDSLSGGNGADLLKGGMGDDFLFGGRGYDVLTTGSGEDIVYLARGGSGQDVVTDFDVGLDSIALESGIAEARSSVADHNGDGVLDLVLKFGKGGSLVLLGVSDFGAVNFSSLPSDQLL